MKTKVTILGEQPTKTEPKKIEVVKIMNDKEGEWMDFNLLDPKKSSDATEISPFKLDKWDNVTLIKKNFSGDLDLIIMWGLNGSDSFNYFLGHFNDGVV